MGGRARHAGAAPANALTRRPLLPLRRVRWPAQYSLKKSEAVLFQRRNPILPFEEATSLEFFSNKNDWCAAGRTFRHRARGGVR
mgnify:CR=1 FL=1